MSGFDWKRIGASTQLKFAQYEADWIADGMESVHDLRLSIVGMSVRGTEDEIASELKISKARLGVLRSELGLPLATPRAVNRQIHNEAATMHATDKVNLAALNIFDDLDKRTTWSLKYRLEARVGQAARRVFSEIEVRVTQQ